MKTLDQDSIRLVRESLRNSKQLVQLFDFYLKRLEEGKEGSDEFTVFALIKNQPEPPETGGKSLPDAAARNATKRLRSELQAFSNTDVGRRLPIQFEVPLSYWGLKVKDKDPYVKSFWKSYIPLETSKQATVPIVYTEHLFFSHKADSYLVRHPEVNNNDMDIGGTVNVFKDAGDTFYPTRQFVNANDVQGLHRLSSFFNKLIISTEVLPAHGTGLRRLLYGRNIVVVGNPRTSPLIEQLQQEANLDFQFVSNGLTVHNPQQDEQSFYETPYNSSSLLYGTISRFFSSSLASIVTMIISNHGRAISAATHLLTTDLSLDQIIKDLPKADDGKLPEEFELLLSVHAPSEEDSAMLGYQTGVIGIRKR